MKNIYSFFLKLWTCLFFMASFSISSAETFVVTIKPLYGLVAKILKGTSHDLFLLYEGVQSPHTSTLKPQDIKRIRLASAVFWIGPAYETGASKYLLNQENSVTLQESRGLIKRNNRIFAESHAGASPHHEENHHHDEHSLDGHLWLHPHNAEMMLGHIAKVLVKIDPANAKQYQQNLIKGLAEIRTLFLVLRQQVRPKHYISFHDFTQYFDEAFHTQCIGTITSDPHMPLTPRTFETLKKKQNDIDFWVTEPQFKKTESIFFKDSNRPIKQLDYLGINLPLSEKIYEDILKTLVGAFQG